MCYQCVVHQSTVSIRCTVAGRSWSCRWFGQLARRIFSLFAFRCQSGDFLSGWRRWACPYVWTARRPQIDTLALRIRFCSRSRIADSGSLSQTGRAPMMADSSAKTSIGKYIFRDCYRPRTSDRYTWLTGWLADWLNGWRPATSASTAVARPLLLASN